MVRIYRCVYATKDTDIYTGVADKHGKSSPSQVMDIEPPEEGAEVMFIEWLNNGFARVTWKVVK